LRKSGEEEFASPVSPPPPTTEADNKLPTPSARPKSKKPKEKSPKAKNPVLVAFAKSEPELFMSKDGLACATVTDRFGNRVTYVIGSADFHDHLKRIARDVLGEVPGDNTIRNLIGTIRMDAKDSQLPPAKVFLRVAAIKDRRYLDLGRRDRKVIEIRPGGWEEIDCPPEVRFIRTSQTGAYDYKPTPGGNFDKLFDVVNIDPMDRPVLKAWLVSNFLPVGGFPILLITGPDGTGKSGAATMTRVIIDPSPAPLKNPPNSMRDLGAGTLSAWVQNFDNLSSIPGWFSDALSALSTGTAFAARALYSDHEEACFSARRPIMLNGIPAALAPRPDLASRCYPVRLKELPSYLTDPVATFESIAPEVLGGLLDMVAEGLKSPEASHTTVRLSSACAWAEACKVCPTPGEFTALITQKDLEAKADILAEWPPAKLLVELVAKAGKDGLEMTVQETLEALANAAKVKGKPELLSDPSWPKGTRKLGEDLDRYAKALTTQGVKIEALGRRRDGYTRRFTCVRGESII
jgi:hypothetical protein